MFKADVLLWVFYLAVAHKFSAEESEPLNKRFACRAMKFSDVAEYFSLHISIVYNDVWISSEWQIVLRMVLASSLYSVVLLTSLH